MQKITAPSLAGWLLAALLAVALAAFSMAYNGQTSRLDRIENKVDAVVTQYSKIDLLEYRLSRIEGYMAEQRLFKGDSVK